MSELNKRHQRQCLYIQVDLLDEIRAEAVRQERSLSWIIQRAWSLARGRLGAMPGANDYVTAVNDESSPEAMSKPTG
jgi:uncharacterized small protein (TIGR04563 family)